MNLPLPSVDLDNCAREPIHIPGSIQPHGVLLALDPAQLRIIQYSSNAPKWLGRDVVETMSLQLADFVDEQTLARIHRLVRQAVPAVMTPLMTKLRYRGTSATSDPTGYFLGTAHLYDGVLIMEFEFEATQQILLHGVVLADFMCMRDVFQNLFSNARKYSQTKPKQIEVGTVQAPEDGSAPPQAIGKLAVFVKDNGIGIANDRLQDVFQVFRRLHQADEYGGGSGVGLAIVKRVVERHGGVVWATSEVGTGSTFYFTLEALNNGD